MASVNGRQHLSPTIRGMIFFTYVNVHIFMYLVKVYNKFSLFLSCPLCTMQGQHHVA